MKYLKHILTAAILVPLVSCGAFGDQELPIPLDETMDNTGAFLRITNVESAAFDILNLEDAAFVFDVEYWDDEGQSLLDNVEFYSNYTGFDGTVIERTLVKTVDGSGWGTGETGWPSTRMELAITEINSALGIDGENNLLGDRYQIDWVLNLTDGRSFTVDDMSPAISGGFFNSPNFANVDVVAAIPEDQFVGQYRFTQLDPATFGPVFETAEFETELSVDPNNTINGRVFEAGYLGSATTVTPHPNPIVIALANDTDNNAVTYAGTFDTGLHCGDGITMILGPENEQISHFELDDDSEFLMVLRDNTQGGCGGSPANVRFLVEKI